MLEFWISKCMDKGIHIGCSGKSSILDNNVPLDQRIYGFHRLEDPMVAVPNDENWVVCNKSEMVENELQEEELKPPEPWRG